MRTTRKRALTWALVAVGVAIVALGVVLALTFPWGQAMQAGSTPDSGIYGPWGGPGGVPWHAPGHGFYGYHHGWGFFHGPRFFGGGLLILVLVILGISFIVRRIAWRGYHRYGDPEDRLDPEEILRRQFAEGRITEEEFKSRREALRK